MKFEGKQERSGSKETGKMIGSEGFISGIISFSSPGQECSSSLLPEDDEEPLFRTSAP